MIATPPKQGGCFTVDLAGQLPSHRSVQHVDIDIEHQGWAGVSRWTLQRLNLGIITYTSESTQDS